MSSTTVQLSARRSITFSSTPDEYGRCVYQVEGVGAFTIEPNPNDHIHSQDDSVRVTFGRFEGEPGWPRFERLPDRPVVNRVTLYGAITSKLSAINPSAAYGWLYLQRDNGTRSVPDGTRHRTAAIVHALVRHWLGRDDHAELIGYHRWHHAPARMRSHATRIDRLNGKRAVLLADLAKEHAGYAEQAAIRDREPLDRRWTPDPTTREGQAILRLREQLLAARHCNGSLQGSDAVEMLGEWLTSMNLTLPDH